DPPRPRRPGSPWLARSVAAPTAPSIRPPVWVAIESQPPDWRSAGSSQGRTFLKRCERVWEPPLFHGSSMQLPEKKPCSRFAPGHRSVGQPRPLAEHTVRMYQRDAKRTDSPIGGCDRESRTTITIGLRFVDAHGGDTSPSDAQ